MNILATIKNYPLSRTALISKDRNLSYHRLIESIELVSQWLIEHRFKNLMLIDDNSIEWVVVDLACQNVGVCITPIPTFFSLEQQHHVISSVNPDVLLTNNGFHSKQLFDFPLTNLNAYQLTKIFKKHQGIPKNTQKITFTSGSTGQPKGVCLSIKNQYKVAAALTDLIDIKQPTHLSLLPFSLLLENIAGIYAPLIAGGTIVIANEKERGFNGCQLIHPQTLLALLKQYQPTSLIIVPELLMLLIRSIDSGWKVPESLTFIAVGGSKISSSLLQKAKQLNLPVYQGYGLSECASVVSLQLFDDEGKLDSVGKVLPHLTTEVINDELVVSGNCYLGYLNQPESWYPSSVYTGDFVTEENNYLYFRGRKNNLIVNSYGRNISPEWIETELLATGLLKQAIILGESKPYCIALLFPIEPNITDEIIEHTIALLNQKLPEYAQVRGFYCITIPFTVEDDLLTANGKAKRDNIALFYRVQIEQLYPVQSQDKFQPTQEESSIKESSEKYQHPIEISSNHTVNFSSEAH